jgi:hypothetical protein
LECEKDLMACYIREIWELWVQLLLFSAPVGDIWNPTWTAHLYRSEWWWRSVPYICPLICPNSGGEFE